MKKFFRRAALALALLPASAFASFISGEILGHGGTFSGSVNTSAAWIQSNAVDGEAVNFWTFTGYTGDVFSVSVTATAIEFGVSLYAGLVEQSELLFAGFDNAGTFADNVYVAGTNPVTGAIGTALLNIVLPSDGRYTLTVGGESGFDFPGVFSYDMRVDIVRVPEPTTIALFASALLALGFMRRRVR